MKSIITLADKRDALHFVVGGFSEFIVSGTYQVRRIRHKRWYDDLWQRLTWFTHRRMRVIAVDRAAGTIMTEAFRWSWRRWGWVKA